MADYADWLEATGGTMGDMGGMSGDAEDMAESLVQRQERDALLCLVDCRRAMFTTAVGDASATASSSAPKTAVKTEGGDATTHVKTSSQEGTTSAFSQAMRCVLQLYQDKVVTSDRDVLALGFYNTAVQRNVYDFSGVYMVHPFTLLGADSVQEVEQLEGSGVPGSAAYREFTTAVGHRPDQQPSSLSDALWAAQHMFLSVGSGAVKFKRIFIFTNDDAPTRGDQLELDRCVARARDLFEAGVVLEVFGLGEDVPLLDTQMATSGGGVTTSTGGPATGSLSIFASAPSPRPHAGGTGTIPVDGSAHADGAAADKAQSSSSGGGGAVVFARSKFWELLLREAGKRTDWAVTTDGGGASATAAYAGAVFVTNNLQSSFQDLLDAVRRKVHPQRPYLNCTLSIGMRTDGGEVPKMAVSMYNPLMVAKPPRTEWLEGATNALIKRKTYLTKKQTNSLGGAARDRENNNNDNEEDESTHVTTNTQTSAAAVIRKEDTRYTVSIGGTTVPFSAEERSKLSEVAAAGAGVGLTVVCFKRYADIIQAKHAVRRCAFLHANLRNGGKDSLRLFVQLVRTLRKQQKVAIAQYIMRKGSAPKLVALVPSPTAQEAELAGTESGGSKMLSPMTGIPVNSLPAEGLGFYVVFLPYADDIRAVPDMQTLTSTNKYGPAKLEGGLQAVSETELQLARDVVKYLTVPYDIAAVPNPVLQLQYHTLQELALRRLTADSGATTSSTVKRDGDDNAASVQDYTLPDKDGMARYAQVFHAFNTNVLRSDYDADKLCPQPRTAVGGAAATARRPRDAAPATSGAKKAKAEDGTTDGDDGIIAIVRDHADRNAWHRLTIPQIKEYLHAVGAPLGGAKKKDELVEVAKTAYSNNK